MIPVPVLTPRLSSLWLGLVTPLYARVGRKLIESIRHATVVQDDAALRDFPIQPIGVRDGDRARAAQRGPRVRRDALVGRAVVRGPTRELGRRALRSRLVDSRGRECRVAAGGGVRADPTASAAAAAGTAATWLWRLRGWIDLLVGGVGMRRGRRDPDTSRSATRSTSGASRRSSPIAVCGWPRR